MASLMLAIIFKSHFGSPLAFKGFAAFVACFLSFCAAGLAAQTSIPLVFDASAHPARPPVSSIGRVRFLVTTDFPPFNFVDMSGRLSGFNVDLAREICRELEIEERCQIQALPFGELRGALDARLGEAVIAGMAVTPELRKSYDFSKTYLPLPARFLARNNEKAAIKTIDDLRNGEVGVVGDTDYAAMAAAFFPQLKLKPFKTRSEMLDALKAGSLDAVFGGSVDLSFWVASEAADGCCKALGEPYYSREFLGEGMTIMSRKGQPLAQAFNSALSALARNGKLNEIYLKYFPHGL